MSKAKEKKLKELIDQMVVMSAEAEKLARELYGKEAFLFEESNDLHVMAGDCDGHPSERQAFLRMSAKGTYKVSGGAW